MLGVQSEENEVFRVVLKKTSVTISACGWHRQVETESTSGSKHVSGAQKKQKTAIFDKQFCWHQLTLHKWRLLWLLSPQLYH